MKAIMTNVQKAFPISQIESYWCTFNISDRSFVFGINTYESTRSDYIIWEACEEDYGVCQDIDELFEEILNFAYSDLSGVLSFNSIDKYIMQNFIHLFIKKE